MALPGAPSLFDSYDKAYCEASTKLATSLAGLAALSLGELPNHNRSKSRITLALRERERESSDQPVFRDVQINGVHKLSSSRSKCGRRSRL
jgi:phage-related protein